MRRRPSGRRLRFAGCRILLALLAVTLGCVLIPTQGHAAEAAPAIQEAQAAMVCDADGNELWSKNPDQRMPMASITKVMTAIVALDSGADLYAPVRVVADPPDGNSQTAGFVVGDETTLNDLLLATLVYSGNDAALNVATIVAGSEEAFVRRMNERAQELGMANTHFANPHGLEEDDHYSCVRDLTTMARTALVRYPYIARAVQMDYVDVTIGGETVTLWTTDELMGTYPGLLGIKTGATEFGTAFLGASKRDGITLYTAVLGCATGEGRFADTAILMDWVYANVYHWRTIVREGGIARVLPAALDIGARRFARIPNGMAAYVRGDGAIGYRSFFVDQHLLTDAGALTGIVTFQQDGRLAGTSSIHAGNELYDVPAINGFALPLFGDVVKPRAA